MLNHTVLYWLRLTSAIVISHPVSFSLENLNVAEVTRDVVWTGMWMDVGYCFAVAVISTSSLLMKKVTTLLSGCNECWIHLDPLPLLPKYV